MIHHADRTPSDGARTIYNSARIPLWRRVTALFTLSSLVIVIGVAVAATVAASALLALFVLERAIAG